jgi:hypothetical protein
VQVRREEKQQAKRSTVEENKDRGRVEWRMRKRKILGGRREG